MGGGVTQQRGVILGRSALTEPDMELSSIVDSIDRFADWLPDWLVSFIVLAAAASLALFLHRTLLRLARKFIGSRQVFLQSLITRSDAPIQLTMVLLAMGVALPAAPLPSRAVSAIGQGLWVAFIVLVGWSATAAIALASEFYVRRAGLGMESDYIARKQLTQVRMLRRMATTLVVIVTAAVALMTFESVRQYGISLIASAGAAGIVVGLAARPLLTNLIAGIQITITQPIRIGDAVIVENEWGWVEEISGTYVVIKLWDWRRLVVPLSYFLEKPFQNWTRQSTDLIGSVLLWVDYTVPVVAVREKLEEIARGSHLWDGNVVNLQVTDASENSIQLRALVSSRTSQQAWDLRCVVREKLIAFLQERFPGSLPKQRTELMGTEHLAVKMDRRKARGGRQGSRSAAHRH